MGAGQAKAWRSRPPPESHLVVAAIEDGAFAPVFLVASYVLRVTTVSRRTLAVGQFAATDVVAREIERIERDRRELD